ncbi:MAG: hypothetical protein CSA65_02040 [Proteobacteria bacterium]|nr:MAG: hypothetical protein CSA65_02040 [Pseudomonadota bacterium]
MLGRLLLTTSTIVTLTLVFCACDNKDRDDDELAQKGTAAASAEKAAEAKKGTEAEAARAAGAKRWADLLGLSKGAKTGKQAPPKPALPANTLPMTLAQAVASFSTFERCLTQIERRLPPDLGADMLKYDNLPNGLCRTREALKQKDITACDRVLSYSLKKGCKTMYGVYHAQPDLCPKGYPKRRGRDAYCVALASRDISLCRAAKKEAEEVRCQAIMKGAPNTCAQLRRLTDRAKCKAEVRRWAPIAKAGASTLPQGFQPCLELTLSGGGARRRLPFTTVEASCARFGVVAPESGFSAHVNGCEYYSYGYRRRYGGYRLQRRTMVDFSYKPPLKASDTVTFGADAMLRIKIYRFGEFVSTGVGAIRFSRFERKRGGRVTATFTTTLQGAGNTLKVKGKLDTFIRDLMPASEMVRHRRYGATFRKYRRYRKSSRGGGIVSSRGNGRLGGILGRLSGKGLLSNPDPHPDKPYAALFTAATLKQITVSGETGFQLSAIRPDSVWERLGIKDGDVVFQVGSIKLRTQGAVVRLRRELRDAKSLKIRLRRGRRGKTLRVSSAQLSKLRQAFRF